MKSFESYKEVFSRYARHVNLAILEVEDKIQTTEFDFSKYRDDTPPPDTFLGLDKGMAKFYEFAANWKLKWHTLPSQGFHLEGSINILPLAEIHDIGDKSFEPDTFPVMRGFHLLDYFYNEAAVGFYIHQPERGLFYFEFDADPQPLYLDFSGYLDLLVYTKGVAYWQLLIREYLNNKTMPGTAKTIEHLPKLFPDFTEQGFIELYESLRMR